ncbi:2,4-diaminopentanoate dehydrogenase [Fusobacteria bacterium ZRK30]|nr:2,4-diaminopentanoate dehydrogenase [Fusobacteria bacterium ZRK30]
MRNIKVAIWGFGAMGSGMAKALLNKKGIEIVGVCDLHPDRVDKEMHEVLGLNKGDRTPVYINGNIDEVLKEKSCDVCLCATDSFVKKAFPRLKLVLEKKINVISTAEEMSYPKAQSPKEALELDRIAKENGVSILGTGINPGLMMDLLVLTLTGAMTDLTHIKSERINSLSPFGHAVMEEQGVGLSKEEFIEQDKAGTLAGHVGFEESVNMMTDAVGWKLDGPLKTSMAPIVTNVPRETQYIKVDAGYVAGCSMLGDGYVDGEKKVEMVHPQQIEPQLGGVETGDYITLTGTPNVNMAITPEIDGGIGTIAMCINMIPQIINSRPGLKTMIDLPIPRCIVGDYRDMIEVELN